MAARKSSGRRGGQGLHGQGHDRRVAAVPVGQQKAFEPVVQQGCQVVFQHVQEGLGPQRDCAGEAHVIRRHAVGHGRSHEQAGMEALGQAQGQVLADHQVGVERGVGSVLLNGADRDHDQLHAVAGALDFGPGHVGETERRRQVDHGCEPGHRQRYDSRDG